MAILEKINPFQVKKKENMKISDYLNLSLISFLDIDTRDEAIDKLIEHDQIYKKYLIRQS